MKSVLCRRKKICTRPDSKSGLSLTGFTIIELIMVIALVGIIAGVAAPFIANAVNYWSLVRSERDAIFSAKLAVNRMVREIREIQNTGTITTYTVNDFRFDRILPDGSSTENIEFAISGNSLLRNTNELADNVQSLTFTYLDVNGGAPASAADINMVRIQLAVSRGDATVTLRSLAKLRNA